MKWLNNLTIVGIASCAKSHDHGTVGVRFTFRADNPLIIRMYVARYTVELSREVFHQAICDGHENDCAVVGLADVTYKVLRSAPHLLSISWAVNPASNAYGSDRAFIMVPRSEVYPWLRETYSRVPKHAEHDALCIDDVITKIFQETK